MLSGTIVEEVSFLSVDELGRLCTVEIQRIVELVDEGILPVATDANGQWRFEPSCLRRARVALRLQRDLGVNLPGVALALELLDEIAALRRPMDLTR
jgi:chaperone modulatory protein CbpM